MGGHSNTEWFSHPRKYGPGSREWLVFNFEF